ncbi:MAG: DUF1295 domain-containing protein [Hyphomonadaceae bacterium]
MSDLAPACLAATVGMLAVMTGAWLTQRAAGNAGWTDVFWTFGSGAALALTALWTAEAANPARQILAAALAVAWALRLGAALAVRVARSPEDARYRRLRQTWAGDFQRRLLAFALKQAPATGLLSISVFVAAHAGGPELGFRDAAGAVILLAAIAGEGLADEQMRRFKARSEHGQIMQAGLWAWSRHPNYFFEWLAWLAWPTIAFDPAAPVTALTWLAPALMFVILRYGTGVPMLEASMLASRGAAFRQYQARVSAFFPLPPKPQE